MRVWVHYNRDIDMRGHDFDAHVPVTATTRDLKAAVPYGSDFSGIRFSTSEGVQMLPDTPLVEYGIKDGDVIVAHIHMDPYSPCFVADVCRRHEPTWNAEDVPRDTAITFWVGAAVTPVKIDQCIIVSTETEGKTDILDGETTWDPATRKLTFTPDTRLPADTHITVAIWRGKGTFTWSNGAPLDLPSDGRHIQFSFSFTTGRRWVSC